MSEIRSVCVLCGSRKGVDPIYETAARRLGGLIAERGLRLVYGGGSVGLMGVVADAVMAAGGAVVGVIPNFLVRREVGHRRLRDLEVTDSMHDRKRRMFELADAFVILPGGLGTLDETFEIVTWKQLGLHSEPIVLLDIEGYWTPLRDLINAVVAGGFADPGSADLFTVASDPEEVFAALDRAPVPRKPALSRQL